MTNFLNSIQETGDFIHQVRNPNLKLHIDTKSFLLSKESIENNIIKFGQIIKHVHISDKDLNELNDDTEIHKELANSLIKINYNEYLSLEMRRIENNEINSIKKSVKFIKENYLN
jgi:sugar phosphate isomerase/epimerase